MEKRNLLVPGITLIGLAGIFFGFIAFNRGFGSRGENDIYSFEYRGEPAVLKHEDIRWGPDRYYISLNEKEKIFRGTLISDDYKKISVSTLKDNAEYDIRDAQEVPELKVLEKD
jgi:hypothetical protein